MILPACGINKPIKRKILDIDIDDKTRDTDDDEEILETETITNDEMDFIDIAQTSIEDDLINTGKFLRPPSKEEDIIEKWFAVISVAKIGSKTSCRFLVDEGFGGTSR